MTGIRSTLSLCALVLLLVLQGCSASLSGSSSSQGKKLPEGESEEGAAADGDEGVSESNGEGDGSVSAISPPKKPSLKVEENAAAVLKVTINPEGNPSSTTYAIMITNGTTTSWIAPDGTVGHAEPVFGTLEDFGGLDGLSLAAQATGEYTVSVVARNGTDSATQPNAAPALSVIAAKPSVTYAQASLSFVQGQTISSVLPENVGGKVDTCVSTPTLPAGLTLSNQCALTGSPSSMQGSATYTITAGNSFGVSIDVSLSIAVIEALPAISYSGSPFSFTHNSSVGSVSPTNSGGSIVSCSSSPILPTGLVLSNACVISGSPSTTQVAANYTLTPSNSTGVGAGVVISIAILPPLPALSYSGSPFTFTRGLSVGTITPTNTGGPTTSCVSSPNLPAGLILSGACAITGTPSATQTASSYTLTPANIAGAGASVVISMAVLQPVPAITYAGSPFTFTDGSSVGTVTPTNTGGVITSCGVDPALPDGLSLSNACVITGTPDDVQSATNYTVTPTNATGDGADIVISIRVFPALPTIAYSGSPFTFTLSTSVGTLTPSNTGGAITACSANPTLPNGLSLSNACVITGSPASTQSAASYVVTPSNDSGNGATATISIRVLPPLPVISYAGSPFTFTRSASVGTITPTNTGGAVASCASSPVLPAGLTLSSSCAITGAATTVQTANTYTVTPTNAAGAGTGVAISITVQQPTPAISYAGSPFTFTDGTSVGTITPSNAGGTITACDVDPTLPSGLSLSSACVLTGTPDDVQSATNYTITPSNGTGDGADSVISIRILPTLPAIAFAGSPFSFTQNATVGTITPSNSGGAVTSCNVDPDLPDGLSLSSACVITGTPTGTQAAATYTITPTNASGNGADVAISIEVAAPPPGASLLMKSNATPMTVSASTSGTHVTMDATDDVPDAPLLVMWQADAGRTFSSSVTFNKAGAAEHTHRFPNSGTTATDSHTGFKYYPTFNSADALTIRGTAPAGNSIQFRQSSIFALDLSSVAVYAPAACAGSIVEGTNSAACTFTVPGGKNGQSWLFLARITFTTASGDQVMPFTDLKFDGQRIAAPYSNNVESNWNLETVVPFGHTFTDGNSKNFTFDYTANTYNQITSASTFNVSIVGIDLTNVGSLIDYNRTSNAAWNSSIPFQTYSSKTLNLPAAGDYLVFTYFNVESPQDLSTVRTYMGSTLLQSHKVTGGGSGQSAYISTVGRYQAIAAGNQVLKTEYSSDNEYAGLDVREGVSVVIKVD